MKYNRKYTDAVKPVNTAPHFVKFRWVGVEDNIMYLMIRQCYEGRGRGNESSGSGGGSNGSVRKGKKRKDQ